MTTAPESTLPAGGVLSPAYRLATLGMVALIGIAAFESLAITTVMPIIARELDGEALYSVAFAAPLASGVVGMVVAGNWADRSGPRVVVTASMVLFAIGLAIVGTAPDMVVLLLGRLVQGLGSGAVIVGLYVMVSKLYPPALHPSIFAGFAAAWVVPGLVGPVVAGTVAELASWHWVFLGAVVVALPAFAMILPSLRRIPPTVPAPGEPRVPWSGGRIAWSVAAALAVMALNLLSELPLAAAAAVLAMAVVVLVVALRPLLPTGALVAATGVPALVLLRGLVGAAFLGSDVYLPYMLSAQYGFAPAASGITLTLGAVAWAAASWAQGRLGDRVAQRTGIRVGIVLVLVGVLSAGASALGHLHPAVVITGWALAGAGMGFMYPRFSVLVLRWSRDDEKGFNSSALTIADSSGSAIALAVTGAAFLQLGGADEPAAFVACFAVAAVVALTALLVSGRGAPRGR
ncbi:MFS transporter [Frigoribacterium sp. VKM Ac-2530]|uniref:MFS transporter n=1 Tax=Frigoribacterium sp. VKM Ac-2530 TaxID=2783822 RepID=UPI00188CA062|nr:MFS transporter [Frigoribacterium sp. VKM Ac-2530]MBF4579020.1 MFS transporter [Frigoribacterium sp. VKM Ac-2530]